MTPEERRTLVIQAAYRVEHQVLTLENATLADVKAGLEAARIATMAILATAGKDWQIAQANALLEQITLQLSAFEGLATRAIAGAYPSAATLGASEVLEAAKAVGMTFGEIGLDTSYIAVAYQTLPGLITNVGNETVARVGSILRQSVLGGLTPLDAMHQIGSLTGKGPFASALSRGETILRTEIGRIAATAAYSTLQTIGESRPAMQREWSAVVDGRTRPSHARADGQQVAMDKPFSIGGYEAYYPHDPRLPASESIGCRCIVVPWHEGWNLKDERPGWSALVTRALDAGFSMTAWGNVPKTGWMISPYKAFETKLDAKSFGATDILGFIKAHQPTLNKPDHYVGAWSDQGSIYLDVAVRKGQKREAAKLGRTSGQAAMFNLATQTTTWLSEALDPPAKPTIHLLAIDAPIEVIEGMVAELSKAV